MSDCCNTTGGGFPSAGDMAKLSMNWPIVWAEIAAIQQAIIAAVSQCPPGCGGQGGIGGGGPGGGQGGSSNVCIGGTTPMTFTSGLTKVDVIDGGMGYYTDVPSVRFDPPFGVTPTATATGTVVTNGSQIIMIRLPPGGTGAGYTPTQSTASVTSSTGAGAELLVTVGPSGSIYGITVTNPGFGYTSADTVSILRAIEPNMFYTDAIAVIGGFNLVGGILSVSILNPGTGYEPSYPTVNIVSAFNPLLPYITGAGFQGYVLTGPIGEITGVIISYSGQGYTNLPPQLVISDSGTGAETRVNLSGNLIVPPGNSVTTIDVLDSGSNYTQDATGQVINPPTAPPPTVPAVVELDIAENIYCTNPNLYYQVWAGTINNASILAQIEFVKSYFTKLGYSVSIITNPETGSTFMWCICW